MGGARVLHRGEKQEGHRATRRVLEARMAHTAIARTVLPTPECGVCGFRGTMVCALFAPSPSMVPSTHVDGDAAQ